MSWADKYYILSNYLNIKVHKIKCNQSIHLCVALVDEKSTSTVHNLKVPFKLQLSNDGWKLWMYKTFLIITTSRTDQRLSIIAFWLSLILSEWSSHIKSHIYIHSVLNSMNLTYADTLINICTDESRIWKDKSIVKLLLSFCAYAHTYSNQYFAI